MFHARFQVIFKSRSLISYQENLGKITVQWPSQDFKGDLDIDYIWVFISNHVSRGIGESKKSRFPFPSVGQFLYDTLKTRHQTCHQNISKKSKNASDITLFGLFLKEIGCRFQKRTLLFFRMPCSKVIARNILFCIFQPTIKGQVLILNTMMT